MAARREFTAVTDSSTPAGEQILLFSSEEEKIIQNGLDRLFYQRRLPNGGEKEQALAIKLMKLVRQDPTAGDEPHGLKGIHGLGAEALADQYRETKGWYYTLKLLSDGATNRWLKMEAKEHQKPEADRNWDLIWFCQLRLKGIPTLVGNFRMTCFFTLQRADGKWDRVVEIVTEKGEKSGKIRLDAESFSTPSGRTGFRTWLMNHGNGCWKGGERELEDLQLDVAHDAAFMSVHEVTAVGLETGSNLWFFGDGCFGPSQPKSLGQILVPDQDGVYWHEGIGYQLASSGSGNQPFAQGLPLMHPDEVLAEEKPEPQKPESPLPPPPKFFLRPVRGQLGELLAQEKPVLDKLFKELCFRLQEALGGFDAYLVLGAFCAFWGRPEFFRSEKCFPGLILHGETGQGKTTILQWMMELAGFHQMSEGVGLSRNSTVVGMQILLEQYSCLPGWLSDFNNVDVTGEKQQIMHGAYNGSLSVKWTPDGISRKSRTMFVVDGESRPAKTSTRYRYVQILVAKMNRRSNQVAWFERNRRFFLPSPDCCCCAGKNSRG